MKRPHRSVLGTGILLAISLATAAAQAAPPQQLDSWQGCILRVEGAPIPVTLEHAATNQQRQWGLMERDTLAADAGMLFFYENPRPASAGFWMYRTLLPLDIAWLDEEGVILAMDTMEPCETEQARDCPVWEPGVRHQNVLEMNAGFFKTHHVRIGDTLVANLNDNKPCPLAP